MVRDRLAGQQVVVDDDERLPLLKATFRNSRLQVITACTGTQALNLARLERPDLMLLDVGLPEMNGYEVYQGLRTDPETSVIRVVMLTAHAGPADQRLAPEAGANANLTKPFSPTKLVASVQSLLGAERRT